MHTELLDTFPDWILLLIASVLLWLVMELGYRFGKWRHDHMPDERDAPVGAMVGSILGLVALVIAFTFSFAASRYDARRLTILKESNAIGTAYLRARLLPEPQATEVAKLFREYVDVRIRAVTEHKPEEAVTRSAALHDLLRSQAVAAAEKKDNPLMASLFIQSLNEVIDVHSERVLVGMRSRIPIAIWAGLFGLSMLGMASVGYQAALTNTRRSPAMLGLVAAFAIVLLLIAELDRGQEGMLRVGQQSMIDLQQSMQPPPPLSDN
jgi:hypothetical protein